MAALLYEGVPALLRVVDPEDVARNPPLIGALHVVAVILLILAKFNDLRRQLQRDTYRAKGYHEGGDEDEFDELANPSEERAENRELDRGFTAVGEIEYFLIELEKEVESAKTYDTQSATKIVGRELNRRVRKVKEQKMLMKDY
ncbi:hypothetical protein C8R42DRAFT_725785 [Lentinula raphanica]|nr:hypothetical protein C8R42DRAFT_725785 [Lentinula raphanica]